MNKVLFSFLFLTSLLQAEVTCKSIILLDGKNSLLTNSQLEDLEGIVVLDLEVPSQSLNPQLEEQFLNQPITEETPEKLRQVVQNYFEEQSQRPTLVAVPPQEVTTGKIQICVLESEVGTITVQGGCHTSSCLLKNYLGVETEDPIDLTKLRKNLNFMNRNPFRHVDLIYSPGTSKGTTDLTLLVDDRRPIRFYAGTDNTGVETTGRGRSFAGINIARIFQLDHFLTYQYTASYDFHQFQAHTVQYLAFFPWRNVLNLYGGYSSVYADLPFPSTRNHGQSYQASGRYIIPFSPTKWMSHEMSFGFDFKRTNNTIQFSEVFPVVGKNVNLSQFTLRYAGNIAKNQFRIDFDGEFFYSPGAILADESNASYATLRPGAKNQWVYGRALLKYFQKLSKFYLSFTGRGQLASQNLLPSEQLGLGGFDSVRGYDERELNYDSGVILNGEILTPAIQIFSRCNNKKFKDAFQILGFVDYGYGANHTPIPGEKKHDYLLGMGPGLRYSIDPWFTARLDLGFKLHQESEFTGGHTMWYFGFIGSY